MDSKRLWMQQLCRPTLSFSSANNRTLEGHVLIWDGFLFKISPSGC